MKVAISVSIGSLPLQPQVADLLRILKEVGEEHIVILAGHSTLDPNGCAMAQEVASKYPGKVFTAFATEGTFSRAYLAGWELGLSEGADFIISMDADGSHSPEDIPRFIELFKQGENVICSSRFMEGAENLYPKQRQALSLGVTLLANTFLVPKGNPKLTDFASGFEALSRAAVADMFKLCPSNEWVSVTHGPYHLQNTILRALVIVAGYPILEMPITYGEARKGKVLGLNYVFSALVGFFLLIKRTRKLFPKSK